MYEEVELTIDRDQARKICLAAYANLGAVSDAFRHLEKHGGANAVCGGLVTRIRRGISDMQAELLQQTALDDSMEIHADAYSRMMAAGGVYDSDLLRPEEVDTYRPIAAANGYTISPVPVPEGGED